jgi:hypothetical protein
MIEDDMKYVRAKHAWIIVTLLVLTLCTLLLFEKAQDLQESRPGSWYLYCTAEGDCSCNIYGSVPLQQAVMCIQFMERQECKNSPPIITEITAIVQ